MKLKIAYFFIALSCRAKASDYGDSVQAVTDGATAEATASDTTCISSGVEAVATDLPGSVVEKSNWIKRNKGLVLSVICGPLLVAGLFVGGSKLYVKLTGSEKLAETCVRAILAHYLKKYVTHNADRVNTDIKKDFLPLFEARLRVNTIQIDRGPMPEQLIKLYPDIPELGNGNLDTVKRIIHELASDYQLELLTLKMVLYQQSYLLWRHGNHKQNEMDIRGYLNRYLARHEIARESYKDPRCQKLANELAAHVSSLVLRMVEPEKQRKDKAVHQHGDVQGLSGITICKIIEDCLRNFYQSRVNFFSFEDKNDILIDTTINYD